MNNLDFTWERLNILSTSELTKLRSIAKDIINERYAKYPPKTKSVFCTKCNGTGINVVDMGDFNHNICCPICKGKGRVLVTIQNDEKDCDEIKVMKNYNIVDTLLKGNSYTNIPQQISIVDGIAYKVEDSFKYSYPQWCGYTYFKWVEIFEIPIVNEYQLINIMNRSIVSKIRKYVNADNSHDVIIKYDSKMYISLGDYSLLYGTAFLINNIKELSSRLSYRVTMEIEKSKERLFPLGYSCIDTGKTIYVGSDECHTCKCYNGSNGKNIKCAIHRLGKK